jgi:hypothetical protein
MVFGWSPLGLEPTIYRTRDKNANHYATDAVHTKSKIKIETTIKYHN